MKRIVQYCLALGALILLSAVSGICAEEKVGTVVALRGTASIERDRAGIKAQVNTPILLRDTVATAPASKVKLLFIDDSVLTLAENSRMVVKEFVAAKEGGGRSIFNLLDGKMRSVVGKQKFEVHTPTAVAAARGTVILYEVGFSDGRQFTRIICVEGEVEVRGVVADVGQSVTLKAGMEIVIVEGMPFPAPVNVSPETMKLLMESTSMAGLEITVPTPREVVGEQAGQAGAGTGAGGKSSTPLVITPDTLSAMLPLALMPPVQQQPSPPTSTQPRSAVITINIR